MACICIAFRSAAFGKHQTHTIDGFHNARDRAHPPRQRLSARKPALWRVFSWRRQPRPSVRRAGRTRRRFARAPKSWPLFGPRVEQAPRMLCWRRAQRVHGDRPHRLARSARHADAPAGRRRGRAARRRRAFGARRAADGLCADCCCRGCNCGACITCARTKAAAAPPLPPHTHRTLTPTHEKTNKASVAMRLPFRCGDYTDFYASRHHAANCGTMLRGMANALPPSWCVRGWWRRVVLLMGGVSSCCAAKACIALVRRVHNPRHHHNPQTPTPLQKNQNKRQGCTCRSATTAARRPSSPRACRCTAPGAVWLAACCVRHAAR